MYDDDIIYLSYQQMIDLGKEENLYEDIIPSRYTISFPLPLLTWHKPEMKRHAGPVYGFFAGPVLKESGQELVQGPPDRWWVMQPKGVGRLVFYGLWSAHPYAQGVQWEPVTIAKTVKGALAKETTLKALVRFMDELMPAYFQGQEGEQEPRQELLQCFQTYVTAAQLPWYSALAPEFFTWLAR